MSVTIWLKICLLGLLCFTKACSSSDQEQEELETTEEGAEGTEDPTNSGNAASVTDIANAAAEMAAAQPPANALNGGLLNNQPAAPAAAGSVAAADFANPQARTAMYVTTDGAAVTDGASATPIFTLDRGDMVVVSMEGGKAKIINGRYIDPGHLSATPVGRSSSGVNWTSP